MPVTPAHARTPALPLLALLTGAIALGSSPILVRLSELEPTATAFYRVALAAPAFLVISYASSTSSLATHKPATLRSELLWLVIAGGFFALDLLCLHWSLRYTTVANATLFLNCAPFFVALGAWLVFAEAPTLRTVLSFAIAITGMTLLVGGISVAKPSQHLGDLLGIGAGAAYGGYLLVVSRFRHHLSTSLVMGVTTLSCALVLLPVAAILGEALAPAHLPGMGDPAGPRLAYACRGSGTAGLCHEIFARLDIVGDIAFAASGRRVRRLADLPREIELFADGRCRSRAGRNRALSQRGPSASGRRQIRWLGADRADRKEFSRRRHQLPCEAYAYEQHEHGKQEAKLLAFETLARGSAKLRPDGAADNQQGRQDDIDSLIERRVQDRGRLLSGMQSEIARFLRRRWSALEASRSWQAP